MAAFVLVAGAAWARVVAADVSTLGRVERSCPDAHETLGFSQRTFPLCEAAFPGVESFGPGNETVLEPSGVQRLGSLSHVEECAEFVDDQPGDRLSHRQPECIAVASPRRPHGFRQWDLHQPDTVTVIHSGEDLAVDPSESVSFKLHDVTSWVCWYTGNIVLHVRV